MPDRRQRRRAPRREDLRLPEGPVPIDTGTAELVVDRGSPRTVTVLVNGVPSSHLDLDDPTWLEFEYMQQMAVLVEHLTRGPLDVVHLGAGACALPRALAARRPGSRQLAVDLDAALLTQVRAWFDLPRSPALRLRPGDARAVLATLPDARTDVVVRDVFAGDRTPDHLCTLEAVADVMRVLRPGGLYLVNCADRPPLARARAELAALRAHTDDVALVAEPAQLKGRRYGNLVLAAVRPGADGSRDLLTGAGLERALRSLPVPVQIRTGGELDGFVGSAAPLRDVGPGEPGQDDDEAAPGAGAAS